MSARFRVRVRASALVRVRVKVRIRCRSRAGGRAMVRVTVRVRVREGARVRCRGRVRLGVQSRVGRRARVVIRACSCGSRGPRGLAFALATTTTSRGAEPLTSLLLVLRLCSSGGTKVGDKRLPSRPSREGLVYCPYLGFLGGGGWRSGRARLEVALRKEGVTLVRVLPLHKAVPVG